VAMYIAGDGTMMSTTTMLSDVTASNSAAYDGAWPVPFPGVEVWRNGTVLHVGSHG
jgi:hypothetical protein